MRNILLRFKGHLQETFTFVVIKSLAVSPPPQKKTKMCLLPRLSAEGGGAFRVGGRTLTVEAVERNRKLTNRKQEVVIAINLTKIQRVESDSTL